MFKYSYLLSSNEIKDKLNLTDNNPEAVKIANLLQDIQPNQLIRPLEMIIYMIDDFYYHEVKRMQKEEMEQW
jgi:hypothetical protein